MKNPRSLKVGSYAARLIDLNEYLGSFTGATIYNKMEITELNEILLNIMINGSSKQAYIQAYDCKTISFRWVINMFDHMEIAESIYEGVVSPSYKKPLGQKPT